MKYPSGLLFLALLLFIPGTCIYSQELPHSVNNTGVYEFLDELASMKLIEINSAVKPFSRLYIANKLNEADRQREVLNPRQQKELDFYLTDFTKEIKETGRNGLSMLWHNGLKTNPARETITRLRRASSAQDSLFSLIKPVRRAVQRPAEGYIRNGSGSAHISANGDSRFRVTTVRPCQASEYLTNEGRIKKSTDWSDMQRNTTPELGQPDW